MRQTRAPARIVLQLPEFSRREQRRYDPPAFLPRLSAIEVAPTQDWGPATKLIPAVLRFPPGSPSWRSTTTASIPRRWSRTWRTQAGSTRTARSA